MNHKQHMKQALKLATTARAVDEVPVGAILIRDELILGEGFNQNVAMKDPTAHAEIVALRKACLHQHNHRLTGLTVIYVTLEPCLMCFCALVHARVGSLVYGAPDPKTGYTRFLSCDDLNNLNHQIQIVSGVMEQDCTQALRDFFREKRDRGKRKWMKTKEGTQAKG